jgi:hypothetical protein
MLAWERSVANAPGDTILVPVRWEPACDTNGCAESYRITWTVRPSGGTNTGAQTARVVRDTSVARVLDTARVVAPPITQPATVCIYVIAVRRTKPSVASSSCRTIESPDVAPPAVKGIKWDSIGVDTTEALRDSLMPGTMRMIPSTGQYDANGDAMLPLQHDSTGAVVASSITRELCVTQAHRFTTVNLLLVPINQNYTVHQVVQHVSRCLPAVRALMTTGSVRVFGTPLAFRIEPLQGAAPVSRGL